MCIRNEWVKVLGVTKKLKISWHHNTDTNLYEEFGLANLVCCFQTKLVSSQICNIPKSNICSNINQQIMNNCCAFTINYWSFRCFRNNRSPMFFKIDFLKFFFQYSQENASVESLLNKKRLQHSCFPVNISQFLRATFFKTLPMAAFGTIFLSNIILNNDRWTEWRIQNLVEHPRWSFLQK